MALPQQFIIDEEAAGERLDSALVLLGAFASRSAAAKAAPAGLVLVNGRPALKSQVLRAGDKVEILAEETPDAAPVFDIPLDIRYEDDDLLVLSKQIGLVWHPDDNHEANTLVSALIAHCGIDHLCNLQGEDDRPGIVHRLDKNTSGLMLAAKTNEAGTLLMEALRDHRVDRRYLALVHGNFTVDSGFINAPIARSAADRKKMAIRDVPGAREASTSFKVLARMGHPSGDFRYTLIECRLHTGRTHQIRVHLEFTGHPLVGETHYAKNAPRDSAAQLGLERQFLHSYYLNLEHPIAGTELTFFDNLPSDLARALSLTDPDTVSLTAYGQEVYDALKDAPHPSIEGEL